MKDRFHQRKMGRAISGDKDPQGNAREFSSQPASHLEPDERTHAVAKNRERTVHLSTYRLSEIGDQRIHLAKAVPPYDPRVQGVRPGTLLSLEESRTPNESTSTRLPLRTAGKKAAYESPELIGPPGTSDSCASRPQFLKLKIVVRTA